MRPKSGRKERAIFVAMFDEEHSEFKKSMKGLRMRHNITLSELLRNVLPKKINDDDFLRYLGMID